MTKQTTILLLVFFLSIFSKNMRAQTLFSENQPIFNGNIGTSGGNSSAPAESLDAPPAGQKIKRQGIFFISPFYQYTRFKELKLTVHSSHNILYQGENTTVSPQEDIDYYNANYGSEYNNSMTGLKIGYQLLEGFGVSGYFGVDHFTFKSWISPNNTDYHSNDNPAVTFGLSMDYETAVYDKLLAMTLFSYNYKSTKSAAISNSSGEAVTTPDFKSKYWEIDLVLGYPIGHFLPYAGAGYTELYINAVRTELIPTIDDNGNDFNNQTEFNSDFTGKSFYAFAGMEYLVNQNLSIYVRSSFMNPLRANLGIKILL